MNSFSLLLHTINEYVVRSWDASSTGDDVRAHRMEYTMDPAGPRLTVARRVYRPEGILRGRVMRIVATIGNFV